MKKYFLNVAKMFLVGATLAVAGCTDYDEDIRDLNERIDKEILENEIAPLKLDLEQAVTDLTAAQEALKNDILTAHNADVALLKDADATLSQKINDANSKILALEGALETTNNNVAQLRSDMESAVANAQSAMQSALDDAVAKLNVKDSELEASLKEQAQKIEDLQASVKNNSSDIETLKTDLAAHITAFGLFEAEIDGKIAEINEKITEIEGRVAANEALIATMQTQIANNKSLAEQNAQDIKNNAQLFNDFKTATNSTISQLQEADKNLTASITTLGDKVEGLQDDLKAHLQNFETYQANIRSELDSHAGSIANLNTLVSELTTKHETEIKLLNARLDGQNASINDLFASLDKEMSLRENGDKALQTQIDKLDATVKANSTKITVLENDLVALQDDVKALEASLKQAISLGINDLKNELGDTNTKLANLGISLQNSIDDINSKITDLTNALNTAKENLQSQIDKLNINVDSLLSRVQSIVYVPTHADGKATINYAKLGTAIIETRSEMTFQVYPADCATTIAALANGESEGNLQFLMQGVQLSRSESTAALNIVSATATEDGRLTITFDARNLSDDFYNKANNVSWSAALYLNNAKNENGNVVNNISTEYINLYPASTATEIKVGIYNTLDEDITYDGSHSVTGGRGDLSFGYNSTEAQVVLPGHYVGYNVDGEVLNTNEMKERGYNITVTPGEHKFIVPMVNGGNPENFKVEFPEVGEEYNYGGNEQYASLSLNNVSADNVGGILIYQYYYDVAGTTVSAYATVYIGPEVTEIEFNPVTIYWNYNLDAVAGDSWGKINRQGTDRNIVLTINDEKTVNLPEDIDLTKFFANLKSMSLDGTAYTTAEFAPVFHNNSLFIANFGDRGNCFDTNGFLEWNKTYTVKATYSNGTNTVNATLQVTTVAPSHDVVALDLGEVEYTIAKDFVIDANNEEKVSINGVAEALNAQYAYGEGVEVHGLGTYAGADNYTAFLTDVFATNAPTFVKTEYFDGNATLIKTNTGSEWSGSKLAIANNEADGWYAAANYTYASGLYNETQTVVYKKLVTLWYGQQVELTRTVKFNLPTYNYAHTDFYVYDGGNRYYSKAQGYYNPSIESTAVSEFSVSNINLLQAFFVNDGTKNLTEAEIAEAGLVRNFSLIGTYDGITITNNSLAYNGKTPEVPVTATLAIANTDGSTIVLPTAFDGEGAYSDYVVKKYDPLAGLTTDAENGYVYVPVGDELSYNVKVLKFFNLYENRDGKVWSTDLINAEGYWTAGDGLNGLATGETAVSLFGLATDYSGVTIPADYTSIISWQKNGQTGVLTFDNKNQIDLANPVVIPVTFAVDYTWGHYEATVKVVFYNPNNGKPSF